MPSPSSGCITQNDFQICNVSRFSINEHEHWNGKNPFDVLFKTFLFWGYKTLLDLKSNLIEHKLIDTVQQCFWCSWLIQRRQIQKFANWLYDLIRSAFFCFRLLLFCKNLLLWMFLRKQNKIKFNWIKFDARNKKKIREKAKSNRVFFITMR